MIWSYDDEYRDEFSKGVHRDILIVPHATKVTPVAGGPPNITCRRPEFEWIETNPETHEGHYEPVTSGGQYVMDDVEWTITNDDIVKEKFKYSYSLNSDQNLTFSSCNSAMLQFTIRNKKEYVEETDDEGNGTGNWYWEQEIPNLYKKEYTKKDPDGTERIVTGEVLSHACIELYMYINGDSSTIQYMGMFSVEEDKLVDGGYNRQITAYDFMATFRDMDIFNWYKHLFTGINMLDNDLEDAMNDSKEETTKPDNYDDKENWVREAKDKWTIGEALQDLFTNLAAYDMATFEIDENGKKIMTKGATDSNPNDYGRDGYPEGNRYSGFGMPIKLDPDLFDKTKKYSIPKESGADQKECYGYMDILELEFYQNPKIMKSESLSFGKFLEDIGMLAGRYPYIRLDDLEQNEYFDPTTVPTTGEHKYDSRYNNYERCILTFKPLPSSERDSKVTKVPEMEFSNHEITKGFQHEYFPTEDIAIFKIPLDDDTEIIYKRLNKEQRVAESKSLLQTFTMPNNMFASYLVTKSDDDEVKKMLNKYKTIREDLFGKETKNGNMSAGAKFQQGYLNMKSRTYTPYQLTTYADTVRECGDRILINFEDKVTGEITSFFSYILEREISGVQKMMDTYTANGTVKNPIFANYQTSLKTNSNTTNQNEQNSDFMTPYDLIEYMRNCGYRLLDEPTDCEAVFCKGGESGGDPGTTHYIYSTSCWEDEFGRVESYIKDGDTTNPIGKYDDDVEYRVVDITVTPGDYVESGIYHDDDPVVPSYIICPLYVYNLNSTWEYVGSERDKGGCNIIDGSSMNVELDEGDGHFYEGSTTNKVIISPTNNHPYYYVEDFDGTGGYKYYGLAPNVWDVPSPTYTQHTETQTITVKYGDLAHSDDVTWRYQYPGIWVNETNYPKLDVPIAKKVKPYVQLKWTDPPDITDWKPVPATWEGTIIIRKEDSAPLHRWDGTKVVNVTTRDKYKTSAYKDKDIKLNKTYYYCFMPYYTIDNSDPEHPIRAYTFTKTIKVETGDKSISSSIDNITVTDNTATVYYTLNKPDVGQFTSIKLYGKIGSDPACDNTDDVIIDIDDDTTSKVISNLTYDSTYYFCLVTVDTNDEKLSSNVMDCIIGPVVIPPEYQPYLDYINNREDKNTNEGFFFYNWEQQYAYGHQDMPYYKIYPLTKLSYRVPGNEQTAFWTNSIYACEPITVRINKVEGTNNYTWTINGQYVTQFETTQSPYHSSFAYYSSTPDSRRYTRKQILGSIYGVTDNPPTFTDSKTSTLENCFKLLKAEYRNINIYVDDKPWNIVDFS